MNVTIPAHVAEHIAELLQSMEASAETLEAGDEYRSLRQFLRPTDGVYLQCTVLETVEQRVTQRIKLTPDVLEYLADTGYDLDDVHNRVTMFFDLKYAEFECETVGTPEFRELKEEEAWGTPEVVTVQDEEATDG